MAEPQTPAAAAQPKATEGAPTPPTSTTSTGAPQAVAGPIDIDQFLDGLSATEVVDANPSEAVTQTPEKSEVGDRKSEAVDEAKAESEAETEVPATDPEEDEDDETVEAKLQDENVPRWLWKRFKKEKEKRVEAEQQLNAAQDSLAQATAELKAPLPSSPLAYLDTPEKLEEEVKKATAYIKWAERPDAANAYDDDEQATAEQKLAYYKARAWVVIDNQADHAKVLQSRIETTANVRKTAPALFEGKSDESKLRNKFYGTDPRTWTDADEFVADAARGRRERLEEAAGKARFQRIDLAAAKANGAAGAKASAAKVNGKTPPIYTPPASASRAPVRSADAPDPRTSAWSETKRRPVTIDELETAGALA